MRRACAVWLVAVVLVAAPRVAAAADITDVASSFDDDNPFDFRFRVRYDHTEKRAQIKREAEGLAPTQSQIALLRDLTYAAHRDALTLRAEVGLFHDLMLQVELPIILDQLEQYGFDQSAGAGCRYAPDPMPNCVNAANSSSVADGIVPATGFDASNGGMPPPLGGPLFRGVRRGASGGSGLDGFDTFNFGLTWAPLSQKRDDTKPTWILSFEPQISIGNVMAFDRARANANHAVSEGVHRLLARTAISRRWHWVEPYMGFWYMYPIARGDSLYKDYGAGQAVKNPQQQAGTSFGVELVPFERRRAGDRIYIDLRGRLDGHFAGRGYSEAWELLASAAPLACDMAQAAFNPACNAAATSNPYQGQPYSGITTIENYASLGVDLAVGAQIGKYARLRTAFEYAHDQSHLITGDDIGVPSNGSGRVMSPSEFNPAFRPIIDQTGRRYRVDEVDIFNFTIWGQFQF